MKIILLLLVILPSDFMITAAQSWMRSGYWFSGTKFPISDINSGLFTHLICAFGDINSITYDLNLSSSDQKDFSVFSTTVKQKNPSVITLLSIGGGTSNYTVYSTMVSQPSYRKSFIDSSVNLARSYGFDGLDFSWPSASSAADATNIGLLFDEWKSAIESESQNKNNSQLFLTMAAPYSQYILNATLPVDSIRKNLDWVHVSAYDYHTPSSNPDQTGSPAALYDPESNQNTDFGITSWISGGLPPEKIVLGLPFYGYAWTLKDPKNNGIGAPANGSAFTPDGDMTYKAIKDYIRRYNAVSSYNSTYVMSYCSVQSTWIGFDAVQVIKAKVSYAKQKNLLGYVVWQVPNDDNWELSQAAAEQDEKRQKGKKHILLKVLLPVVSGTTTIVLVYTLWRMKRRLFTQPGLKEENQVERRPLAYLNAIESNDSHFLQVFSFDEIRAATNEFSEENKLGEGGYGPVYKGKLQNGQEVAVKRLSETSKQGREEFKTEVLLTARLQHINLLRVLGYCTEMEEKILIYEYMPNKSLDFYIYDPVNRLSLDWEKRVQIITGVTQGLLYLQEYSRITVIHRDLKASNILLDHQMKPKIADFGIAKIFQKDILEANTDRVVGTYGYIPPEYIRGGIYSTKSDVFSFGVLLLQIISGKKSSCYYGQDSNLNLLQYAYELWRNDKGQEFLDETLNDANSSFKLMTCLHIALQCVQEDPKDRPTMLEISYMLRNETTAMKQPKRPAFSITKDGDTEKSSASSGTGLVDTATITTLVPR
ncbi:OLC1v1035648C1 [Oldenlandia corymbosa var. corymbosa]|uniref:non-specific serine/threonine protein kinase n=1 Tax=Oldenlandia corymbosa var. corymbosa TaxID=529605 RepID=A0AAV1CUB3_OLDCO|nr:OLC1v1035648C1 [Oldenlandia corymbosa var. corymbosa]